jgi:hypothetical protein
MVLCESVNAAPSTAGRQTNVANSSPESGTKRKFPFRGLWSAQIKAYDGGSNIIEIKVDRSHRIYFAKGRSIIDRYLWEYQYSMRGSSALLRISRPPSKRDGRMVRSSATATITHSSDGKTLYYRVLENIMVDVATGKRTVNDYRKLPAGRMITLKQVYSIGDR